MLLQAVVNDKVLSAKCWLQHLKLSNVNYEQNWSANSRLRKNPFVFNLVGTEKQNLFQDQN